jgi:Zn-dependent metalloprotease
MGSLFGLSAPRSELRGTGASIAGRGRRVFRFQQFRDGIPVLGGELIVHTNRSGDVILASGEVLPSSERLANPARRVTLAMARRTASEWVGREAGTNAGRADVRSEGLAILDPRILGGPPIPTNPGPRLVWRLDARASGSASGEPVHHLVLVDAGDGSVAATIPRAHSALVRRICDFRNVPRRDFRCRPPYRRSEGAPQSGVNQVDSVYRLIGDTYAFYQRRFGRDGIDRNGAPMVATVRYCKPNWCTFQNAFWEWGPQQTAFGDGWASADDIVGHEFTHGVLDHEARLFYYFQSGALNESFADIFGELVDLSNGSGDDRAAVRWLIGEDLRVGVLRDMQQPGRFGDPDRIRSSRWRTSSFDNGGVHNNSGVGNKAASLMADGGRFNGRTVNALGLTRTAWIEYEAMTNLLTSASDYLDLHDALQQACRNLVGTHAITLSSCRSVREAVTATDMDRLPRVAAPRQAIVCGRDRHAQNVFLDDLERPASGLWARRRMHGRRSPWFYPPNPNNRPSWDGTWASSGSMNFYGADLAAVTDSAMTLTRAVRLPPRAFLRFEHGFRFDAGRRRYDGGIVEISVDGGAWRKVASRFTHSGYTGRLARGRGNPLGGTKAFTGDSRGWGASRIDLSDFAGHNIRLRFRIASDRAIGSYGWYIDDIRIYRCVPDR